MKFTINSLTMMLILISASNAQIDQKTTYHPFSNAFIFTTEFGGTVPFTDFAIPELDYSGRILAEYYFSSQTIHTLGIRLIFSAGYICAELEETERDYPPPIQNFRTGFILYGCGISYALNFGNAVVYLSGMISFINYDPRSKDGYKMANNADGIYEPSSRIFTPELGVRFPFIKIMSLNLGFNLNFADTDNLDDLSKGLFNDTFYSVFMGFSIYLGSDQNK